MNWRRWLWWLFLLAVVAGVAYLLVQQVNPGYVLVYVGGYSFETTLVGLLLAVLGLWLAWKLLLWLLRTLNPLQLRNTRLFRRFAKPIDPVARSQLAMQDLLLGQWSQAYRTLLECAPALSNPQANYFAAAFAAFQQGDANGWRYCLQQAEQSNGQTRDGVNSLRALFAAHSGDAKQALAILHDLNRALPNQPWVLRQLFELCRAQQDWQTLATLLPAIEKTQSVPALLLQQVQEQVFSHQLTQAANENEKALRQQWKQLPKTLNHNGVVYGLYIQHLLKLGQESDAASQLAAFLKQGWSDALVALLGQGNVGTAPQQLALLEACLSKQPQNPQLLLTLGRVAMRNQLWRKAQDYLTAGLQATNSPQLQGQLNAELATLAKQLGDSAKSVEYLQQAVALLAQK